MDDPIRQLYERQAYPAMSHPVADPATMAATAHLIGFPCADPACAQVVEIGCGVGLHLIPLALRWPESRFVGLDLSESQIAEARSLAREAGVSNVEFHAGDLRQFDLGSRAVDFIIAHGFFSWVPDPVKAALFGFCRRHLATNGLAAISFNVLAGWVPRAKVVAKSRAVVAAGATGWMEALAILREVAADGERAIIDDMLAKGHALLAFDDFGPVNDPWPLDGFVAAAGQSGLQWLGETDPYGEEAWGGGEGFETLAAGQGLESTVQRLQQIDQQRARTFRSALIARRDRVIQLKDYNKTLKPVFLFIDPSFYSIEKQHEMDSFKEEIGKIIGGMTGVEVEELRDVLDNPTTILRGIRCGWWRARWGIRPWCPHVPEKPDLGRFRLSCLRRGLPLVDRLHRPCVFPEAQRPLLALMDGSRDVAELELETAVRVPGLSFRAWMEHLAARGLFS